jgi:hypothetical protein
LEQEVDRAGTDPDVAAELTAADELCALLSEELANGESEKTLAIGARIVALGDDAVDALVILANSGNSENEIVAVRLLCRIGTARAIAVALGRVLAYSPDQAHGVRLLEQFAGIRSPSVSGLLVEMMGETEQVDVTDRIGTILNVMEGPFAVRALAAGLANALNEEHRQKCLLALAGMKKPSNVSALEQMLSVSDDVDIDASIAQALAGIGNEAACETLAAWAGAEQTDIFAAALSSVSSPYGQRALLDILDSAEDSPVRAAAAQALGNYVSEDLRKQLSERASSEENDAVRNAMINSVRRMEGRAQGDATTTSVGGELIEMSDR